MCSKLSTGDYWREVARFYLLKLGLLLAYLSVRIRAAFGLSVDEDEMQDFELD